MKKQSYWESGKLVFFFVDVRFLTLTHFNGAFEATKKFISWSRKFWFDYDLTYGRTIWTFQINEKVRASFDYVGLIFRLCVIEFGVMRRWGAVLLRFSSWRRRANEERWWTGGYGSKYEQILRVWKRLDIRWRVHILTINVEKGQRSWETKKKAYQVLCVQGKSDEMRINFESGTVVSGHPWGVPSTSWRMAYRLLAGFLPTTLSQLDMFAPTQGYVIIAGQIWLDGGDSVTECRTGGLRVLVSHMYALSLGLSGHLCLSMWRVGKILISIAEWWLRGSKTDFNKLLDVVGLPALNRMITLSVTYSWWSNSKRLKWSQRFSMRSITGPIPSILASTRVIDLPFEIWIFPGVDIDLKQHANMRSSHQVLMRRAIWSSVYITIRKDMLRVISRKISRRIVVEETLRYLNIPE